MSTQPDWHDAPTCAGDWIVDQSDGVAYLTAISDNGEGFDWWRMASNMYYGPIPPRPIPPDPKESGE